MFFVILKYRFNSTPFLASVSWIYVVRFLIYSLLWFLFIPLVLGMPKRSVVVREGERIKLYHH